MDSVYLPQELIDMTISHIEDRRTLASVRLASSSCCRGANPIYFKRLYFMLSVKSVTNVRNLIQSPYRGYVEEIHWVDKEFQDHLQSKFGAFQDAFKERLAGLSRDDIVECHKKYRTMFREQENIDSHLHAGGIQLNLESFINLKKVSVNNGCGLENEQYPAALNPQEILDNPAKWTTMRQFRPMHGGLYALILKSLAKSQTSHNITHFSITTEASQWDSDVLNPTMNHGGPIFMFESIQHLDINLCLSEQHSYGQDSTVSAHLINRRMSRNLQSLTIKLHPHAEDEMCHIGRPLIDRNRDWASIGFSPRPKLWPQLRHFELHRLSVHYNQLINTLGTLKHSLQSIVLVHCVLRPSLFKAFKKIREKNIMPPTAIFRHTRDYAPLAAPVVPIVLTEEAITPYLLWSGMSGTLSLHDWDKQIKGYVDQHSGDTKGA
ncbi:hypothetical protein V492_07771 [Pseudogymnoascus sp. VKM F-4246]|nr:hypothetical protein V492_07771 [Pseudogymnoascus sp. VKM F-4246]